ncbi:DinB family protein [Lunatibacter salilacus]|uniref:DinB family protein n=1 Tax=Lunatibacter salilacus TaxID=2483804 RepID=UPI00131B06E7|nr:DinB family protein [Lunatibacter salilacus]
MKNLQKLIDEITKTTLLIESKYPELYCFLDENPITIPIGNGHQVDEKSLQIYLESLQQLLLHHIEEHKKPSEFKKANSLGLKSEISKLSRDVRERTLKRLQQIPLGFINWRLNSNSMSFGDIAVHLVYVDELFMKMMEMPEKKYVWVLGIDTPQVKIDRETFTNLLIRLRELQSKREAILEILNESDFSENVRDENGEDSSLWWFVMDRLIEHEVYHRGQMSAYLKLLKGEAD